MKTKVKVVFSAAPENTKGWPYINYDADAFLKKTMLKLEEELSGVEFTSYLTTSEEDSARDLEQDKTVYDGYVVYCAGMPSTGFKPYVENVKPFVIVNDIFSGTCYPLQIHKQIKKDKMHAYSIMSSDFTDVVNAIKLFEVMAKMKQTKILAVSNDEDGPLFNRKRVEQAKNILGTDVITVPVSMLKAYYHSVDIKEAEIYRDQWLKNALTIKEPTVDDLLKSARMYLAMKTLMLENKCDAITVNCLNLFYANELNAYPCLGFSQLCDDGYIGACEADINSTLMQLIIKYLTGKNSYVSDPEFDTSKQQIIYAHCVAPLKLNGCACPAQNYIIRSHAEDGRGASLQVLFPENQIVTTALVCPEQQLFIVHNATTDRNIDCEKACRTKIACIANVEKIIDNFDFDIFGWHRVTCLGDHRKELIKLAELYGWGIIEEDR